ncbi:MAG: hypothetical protein EOM80_07470 [Erysipelotrichia bacterium]|nr:hypothetical protein [Erysipelotrichia bacterium]
MKDKTIPETFASIRGLIFQKQYEQAWAMLKGLSEPESQSGDAIALSARLQGQMGHHENAVSMFEDLESAWPERIMIFKLHASFLQEAGQTEDALDKARQMIEKFPDAVEGYIVAIECFELLGQSLEGLELAQRGIKKWPGNLEILDALTRLEPVCRQQNQTISDLSIAREEFELNHCQITPDEAFVARYMQLFSGREGVYAKQCRMKGRKLGYMPVYEALDKAKIKAHIAGDTTLGIYLVKRANTASLLVLDIDVGKAYLGGFLSNYNERERIKKLLIASAIKLIEVANRIGVNLLCESSGHKGLHLWAFSDFELPARHWRLLGKWMLEQLYGLPSEIQIEVFPKQEVVTEGGLGNLVKLPLGIHMASGQRSLFLDSINFRPVAVQREAIDNYQALTRSEFEEVMGRLTVAKLSSTGSTEQRIHEENFSRACNENNKNTTEMNSRDFALRVKIALPERFTIEIEQILAGCRPLCEILTQIMHSQNIEPSWRHVLIYIFATVGEEGKVFIHQLLSQLPDYDPDRVNAEIKAVPPTTMSCNKVRKNLSTLIIKTGCNCQFRLPQGCYASPVVHAGIFPGAEKTLFRPVMQPVALSSRELIAGASAAIDRLMREYNLIGEEILKARQRQQILHRQINRLFDECGSETIVTRIGSYNRLSELPETVNVILPDSISKPSVE